MVQPRTRVQPYYVGGSKAHCSQRSGGYLATSCPSISRERSTSGNLQLTINGWVLTVDATGLVGGKAYRICFRLEGESGFLDSGLQVLVKETSGQELKSVSAAMNLVMYASQFGVW